jgi:hypothetical protein
MTMRHLLLGSAAALTAIGGAQAADLPVKAKPIEYVKICSLYGEGFYYIPGSQVCLKIGGYVRADYGWNVTGARTAHYTGVGGRQDRTVDSFSTRHRGHFNFDSRTQTAYGTLRTYIAVHVNQEDQARDAAVNLPRAFIQWAGFTFGRTKSFTDVPGTPGDDTFKSLHQTQNQSDTGANGTNQIAYTFELGNGMTLNIGADERRVRPLTNFRVRRDDFGEIIPAFEIGGDGLTSRHGMQHPNPWINFAVNQAWGRLGISAILNPNKATYYGADSNAGSPDDKWGWAVLSGIDIKAPFLGPGDHFGGYFNYGVGAVRYSGGSNLASPGLFGSGNEVAVGVVTDAVFRPNPNSQIEMTTAWTAGAGWEHFWLPNVSTGIYGTYTEVSYNDTVIQGKWFCGANGFQLVNRNAACDPGFTFWTVGMVNNWYPVPGFRLAVDVLYTQIETAMKGEQIEIERTGARPAGVYDLKDQGIWSVVFRAQRSFASGD